MNEIFRKIMMSLPISWQREWYRIYFAITNNNPSSYLIYRKSDGYVYSKGIGFVKPVITSKMSFEVYSTYDEVETEQALLKQQGYDTAYYVISGGITNQSHFIMFL